MTSSGCNTEYNTHKDNEISQSTSRHGGPLVPPAQPQEVGSTNADSALPAYPPPTGSVPAAGVAAPAPSYPPLTGSVPVAGVAAPAPAYPPPSTSPVTTIDTRNYPPPSTAPVYSQGGSYPPPPSGPSYHGVPQQHNNGGASSMESWIGRNVIGIIAAVMVFLGMLFLGFLVIPSLSDAAKIALMFILSGVLVVAGTVLTLKKKNNFTTALLGCGCGSLFIAIMLTHTFFRALPDVAAFALLLLWLAGTLVLAKVADSLLMSIIAHVGMVISLCFAYAVGLSQDRLALIVVYHALSVGLIIAGDIICCKKTLKLGLYASLFLSLIAVVTMYVYCLTTLTVVDVSLFGAAIAAFGIQLLGAFVLALALARSTARLKDSVARVMLHLLTSALLLGVVFVTTFLFPLVLTTLVNFNGEALWATRAYSALLVPTLITSLISFCFICICLAARKKIQLDKGFEVISVITLCLYVATIMLGLYGFASIWHTSLVHMPGLILVALVLAACMLITKDTLYLWMSFGVLMADLALMLLDGYSALVVTSSLVFGFIYLTVSLALLVYLWSRLSTEKKATLFVPFKLTLLGLSELSIIAILFAGEISGAVSFLVITAAFLVLYALKFDARDSAQKGLWLFMRIHELVLVVVNTWFIAFRSEVWPSQLIYLALALASIALLVCMVVSVSRASNKHSWLGAIVGLCFTLVVIASIQGMTSWFEEPYVLSLALMVSALICVIGGFITKIRPLRLYGLILVLCCVLKLVTIDVGNAETLMRVVAFISGGLICFGISALYNYAVKHLDTMRIDTAR